MLGLQPRVCTLGLRPWFSAFKQQARRVPLQVAASTAAPARDSRDSGTDEDEELPSPPQHNILPLGGNSLPSLHGSTDQSICRDESASAEARDARQAPGTSWHLHTAGETVLPDVVPLQTHGDDLFVGVLAAAVVSAVLYSVAARPLVWQQYAAPGGLAEETALETLAEYLSGNADMSAELLRLYGYLDLELDYP